MEFSSFAEAATEIEDTTADLDIVALVADLLEDAGEDLPIVARFVQGRVFPAHSTRKLDIGPSLCYEALARAAGQNVTPDDVEDRLAEMGDIGAVAASLDLGGQVGLGAFGSGGGGSDGGGGGDGGSGDGGSGTDSLTVASVYDDLESLATAEGSGSTSEKVTILFGLFNECSPVEARFLARIVLGEMRIGVGEGTVRDAIAEAFDVPVESVERALQVSNDYGLVAEVARRDGESGLDTIHLEIGRPVQAMLAQAGSVTDALDSWDEAAVEWKFDGARVQLHHDPDGETRVFSRNMEDVTTALPEVVELATDEIDEPVILDGEVVAIDDDGNPLPFQEILRRFRRKHDVEAVREEVGVELRTFDCLHVDGVDLLDEPLTERHEQLSQLLDEGVSDLFVTDDPNRIAEIDHAALDAGHEGIMLKNPDSTYSPGRRGKNWLKRKPDVETLDLVVTGAEWGEGRRASFLGTFLLSVNDGDEYATIGKVATGIDDEELAELTELLEPHIRRESGQEVDIEPAVVFEVGFEEIQTSPTYESGYALRFPRFLGVRSDKDPRDADSMKRVERLVDGDAA